MWRKAIHVICLCFLFLHGSEIEGGVDGMGHPASSARPGSSPVVCPPVSFFPSCRQVVASNNVNSVGGASGVGSVRAGGGSPLPHTHPHPTYQAEEVGCLRVLCGSRGTAPPPRRKATAAEIPGTTPRPVGARERERENESARKGQRRSFGWRAGEQEVSEALFRW